MEKALEQFDSALSSSTGPVYPANRDCALEETRLALWVLYARS